MKEATGEANMTIVTVILIAAIVAIATPLVMNMMNSTKSKTACMNAGLSYDGSTNDCVDENGNHSAIPTT